MFVFFISSCHGDSKLCHFEVFFTHSNKCFPVEEFTMDRFVSKRSSSSVDLDASCHIPSCRAVLPPATKHVVLAAMRRGRLPQFQELHPGAGEHHSCPLRA